MVENPLSNAGDAGSIPGQEDPLEKEMATHSSILAWEIPWTEEPGGLQSIGKRAKHNLATKQQQHTICLNHRSFPSLAGCVRDFNEIQFILMECSQIIFQFGILRSIVFSD